MTITPNNLLAADNATDGTSFTIPSATYDAAKPCILWVAKRSGGDANVSSITPPSGVTATLLGKNAGNPANNRVQGWLYWLTGSGTGTITIVFNTTIWNLSHTVTEFAGAATTTPTNIDVSNQAANSTPGGTLGSAASTSLIYGIASQNSAAGTLTADSPWTATHTRIDGVDPVFMQLDAYNAGNSDLTPSWTSSASGAWVTGVVEIAEAAGGPPPSSSTRRGWGIAA